MIRSVLFLLLAICALYAQQPKYPFPQKVIYPYGVMPSKQDSLTGYVQTWYDDWKKNYLKECNGALRPGVDPLEKSLVEAQGFAMVAIAYMGDKSIFDKMYDFYKSKCSANTCGLMNWKVNCTGVEPNGAGAATDGDIDVACALIVANWQWPDAGYDTKAKDLIGKLDRMITQCSGLSTVYPGCNTGNGLWGGCNETDISYYAPAFFRYFAELTGDDKWKKLADDTHTIRDNAANKTTGLVPDWQSVAGNAGAGSRNAYFGPDAIRAPYKQALDYVWHGNEKAKIWAQKLARWGYDKEGVANIVDAYELNGTKKGTSHNMAVMGSIAVAAMADSQNVLDAYVGEVLKIKAGYWYSAYLGNLYLLALSGNMWTPAIVANQKTAVNCRTDVVCDVNEITVSRRTLVFRGLPEGTVVSLSTLSGRLAVMLTVRNGQEQISVGSVQRGCYMLRLTNADHAGVTARRVVVW